MLTTTQALSSEFIPMNFTSTTGTFSIGTQGSTRLGETVLTRPRVFRNGTDFYKDPAFFGSIAFNDSIAFLTDPHEYKLRYDIVKISFAKGHVDLLAPELKMIVTKAINQAKIAAETQCPLNIQQLYHCVTVSSYTP